MNDMFNHGTTPASHRGANTLATYAAQDATALGQVSRFERPQVARHTPHDWRGDSSPVHGFPMPPERAGTKETIAKFGKYHLPDPRTGQPEKFPRATSLAHAIDDKAGLIKWLQRTAILGLKRDPELLDDIDLFADKWEVNKDLDKVIDQAQVLAGNAEASEKGTAIHAWAEEVECHGLPLEHVPDMFREQIAVYLRSLSEYGITCPPGMAERLVWHEESGHVGTLDRLWRLADGTLVIGDLKTSKTTSLSYGLLGFAMQTAIYADAQFMWNPEASQWEDMPAISNVFSVIAHLPSDAKEPQCEMITLDLQAGREALELAIRIKQARENAKKTVAGVWDLPRPEIDLKALVLATRNQEELIALWNNHQNEWTPELTNLGNVHLRNLGF